MKTTQEGSAELNDTLRVRAKKFFLEPMTSPAAMPEHPYDRRRMLSAIRWGYLFAGPALPITINAATLLLGIVAFFAYGEALRVLALPDELDEALTSAPLVAALITAATIAPALFALGIEVARPSLWYLTQQRCYLLRSCPGRLPMTRSQHFDMKLCADHYIQIARAHGCPEDSPDLALIARAFADDARGSLPFHEVSAAADRVLADIFSGRWVARRRSVRESVRSSARGRGSSRRLRIAPGLLAALLVGVVKPMLG